MDDKEMMEAKRKARGEHVRSSAKPDDLDVRIRNKVAESMAKPTEAAANRRIDDFDERIQKKVSESMTQPKKAVVNNEMDDLDARIQNKISADLKKSLGKVDEFDEEAGSKRSYHHVADHDGVVMPDTIKETYDQSGDKLSMLKTASEPAQQYDDSDDGGDDLAVATAVVPGDDEDDEIHDVAVEFDPDAKIMEDKRRRCKIYGVASICLLIIVAIAVAVPLSLKKPATLAPTESPTLSPTLSPNNTDVTTQLEAFFGFDLDGDGYPENVDSESIDENLIKTFEWFKEDGWDQNEPNIVQRFLMGYLSFTWNASSWIYCFPDSSNSECSGIDGEDKIISAKSWLSKEHECTWFGVWCPTSEEVHGLSLRKYNN